MSKKSKRSGNNGRQDGLSRFNRIIKTIRQDDRADRSKRGAEDSKQGNVEGVRQLIQAVYKQNLRGTSLSGTASNANNNSSASVPGSSSNVANPDDRRSDIPIDGGRGRSGGDSSQESISQNDVNELLQVVHEALNDQRVGQWRNPRYRSPMISPIVDQLRSRLITMNSIILPPILRSQLGIALDPIRKEAETLGDIYFGKAMDDLSQGRVDRLDKLLWLSGINQVRLKLAKEEIFKDVIKYVKENYASDPADPNASTFFIPSESESVLAETWMRIHELVESGLVMIREVIQFKVATETHSLTILTIADTPITPPSTSILDLGK